jgi:phosphoserine phosphatase RsbU/P
VSLIQTGEYQWQQIRKLTEVSHAITYAASLDEVFQLTVYRAADLLAAERSLLLVTNPAGLLAVRSSHGVDLSLAQDFQEPFSEALIARLAACIGVKAENFVGVPLVVAGAIKGVLLVIGQAPSTGTGDEWLLSALADQAAVALENGRLDEMAEFREQLIGIVSHDLRNPLGAIVMAAHVLLRRHGLGAPETGLVRRITSSAMQASALIDQLLDLTRSRLGGGIPIAPSRFDLNDICGQVVGETELVHPERPLLVNARGDLTGTWDRNRLYQLLGNLVGNAVQHGEPRSPIELRIDGGEGEVVIEVTNRGEPIPGVTLPFIFDAFRKGRASHATPTHGLGLGLFIAQQIVRAHGGTIAVTSSERIGTTFRVRLPREVAASTP